jgi:transcription initiation factor TFIIIB Brf1 subunit/transcription initiation factor TFIIB
VALLDRCGNCGSIEVMPGLSTVQCLKCGWVTRYDGLVTSPDERFTKTQHEKHQDLTPFEDPVEENPG